jgi:dienelactone hydrolase
MTSRSRARSAVAALAALATFALTATSDGAQSSAGPDCVGPAGDPQPGTAAWDQREADNAYCGEQRAYDTDANPLFGAGWAQMEARHHGEDFRADPFRDPLLLEGSRFRYQDIKVAASGKETVPGMLFRPCDRTCGDLPAGLRVHKPPYPGVMIVHGGAANQEMYLWGAEGLAEQGYEVLTFQLPTNDNLGGDAHYKYSKRALDYFTSPKNPGFKQLARHDIGLAGHSAGGVAVSRLGQEDRRISAIVSWDRAQSGPMPPHLAIRTPAMFQIADYLCQRSPLCVPQPYTEPPNPAGPGDKGEDFKRVKAAGVDTMQMSPRASTHLDFTQFSPGTGSRYGAAVSFYYTLAWFDRYLKGEKARRAATARLTSQKFDDSGDVHSISGGVFDPGTGSNVPAKIAGQPIANRLSFEFRSKYFLGGGDRQCTDMRAGCPAP